ncbi:squalene/phytoene synthase family protein [Jannaschia sp. M317]|uniref:phytoene/squalene synthase family protein n=1 Tax=Jannaschia sp. M317 TaxID=2867011 RepID=UPI0021A64595|nr:squalene/phytoene synthase family protein [Jannaschia sp. M317]UWQ16640.1 squalene/phytoene synthase family protein [Jannaschia sp. M317]
MSDDLTACAGIVQRGDPDRFAAVMAAPVDLRRMLLPLYAFNVEVARAPWVTQEPLIAEMRLQWWRDALEQIGTGGPVRRHEVVTPLADILDAEAVHALDGLIEARRADIDKGAPEGRDALVQYLDETAGTLLWTAARLAGSQTEDAVRAAGRAQGVVGFLRAVPDLLAKGHHALPHGDPVEEIRVLAETGQQALRQARASGFDRAARPVLAVLAGASNVLARVARAPEAALDQPVDPAPFRVAARRAAIVTFGRI